MLVVVPFCLRDESLALKNAKWIASLKHDKEHEFFGVNDSRCDRTEIQNLLRMKQGISVSDNQSAWPASANTMFSQAARYIQTMPVKYFLWLEPDAWLLGDYALDKIEEEYLRAGKPFMGALVPRHGDNPEHLSGIAVYPNPLVQYAGMMLMTEGEATPFDIADPNVVQLSHFTDLIQNNARAMQKVNNQWTPVEQAPVFNTKEEFYRIVTRECVLFHSDKRGVIPELFGGARHGPAETPTSLRGSVGATPKPVPSTLLSAVPDQVEQPEGEAREISDLPRHSCDGGQTLSTTVTHSIIPNGMTLQEHVDWLKEYASKDGFARMRVFRALINAGLRQKKKKR